MALTKISRGLLNTGVTDSSDATAITISSAEKVTVANSLNAPTSIQTPLIEFTDGDDAISIADGGAVTMAKVGDIGGTTAGTGAFTTLSASGNLTVGGNLTVTGTTTQVDTVTMNAQNAVIFEGSTADNNETTLTIVDPTADRTQYLINQTGYIPVLAAVTTTAITSTPAELNILDGVTSTTAELNLLDGSVANTVVNSKGVIYGSSGELAGTLSTAAQTNITSLGTLTTLTVDDITINGSTISDAGAFDIDAGGVIKLDAGGGQLQFFDDGTEIGVFESTGSDFIMESKVSDKDIIFKGNDGGSGITALTLDMSDAGRATFNDDIVVADKIYHTTTNAVHYFGAGPSFGNSPAIGRAGGTNYHVSGSATGDFVIAAETNKQLLFGTSTSGGPGERMRIEAGGNVGIGETSPLGKLHIKGTDTGASASAQGNSLVLEDTENGLSILSSTAGAGYINFGDSGDNNIGIILYDHSSNSMRFTANAAEQMRISANVISVKDAARLSLRTTDANTYIAAPSANTIGFYTGDVQRINLDSSGRLALGHTTTTGAKFAICDGANSQIQFFPEVSTDTNLIQHYDPTAAAYINSDNRAATFSWRIGTAQKMVMDSNGDVGIGETSPANPLHVKGTRPARFERAGVGAIEFSIDNVNTNSAGDLVFEAKQASTGFLFRPANASNSMTAALSINRDGNVGIGTTVGSHPLRVVQSTSAAGLHMPLKINTSSYNDNGYYSLIGFGIENTAGAGAAIGFNRTSGYDRGSLVFMTRTAVSHTNPVAGDIRMVIDKDGKVGMGTTSPSADTRLSVTAASGKIAINATGTIKIDGGAGSGDGTSSGCAIIAANTDSGAFYTPRGGRYLTSNSSGWQSGIDGKDPVIVISENMGTTDSRTNPGLIMHNESPNDACYSPFIGFGNKSASGSYNSVYAAIMGKRTGQGPDSNWNSGDLEIYTAAAGGYMTNSPTMAITASKTVVIKGANNNTSLDAILYVSKTGNNDWTCTMGKGADDYGLQMDMVGNYALAVRHQGDGNYEFRVDTNGAIYATDTSVNSISDRRLKENIVDAKSQWDDIKALKWRNFNWNAASGRSRNNTLLGLIADEVESISPNLVGIDAQGKEDKDAGIEDPEYKNVKYSIVWMKAMKALQEAMERIETLETENKELEEKLNIREGELEQRVHELEQRLI